MENTIKVEFLSQYISAIENLKSHQYVFRGQDNPYYGICASAFRPYKGGWDTDSIFDVQALINDYYRRTVRNLNSKENEHFLAFSQHHGIPTNLVDFTVSPLVALFFACSTKQPPYFTVESLTGHESFSSVDQLKNDTSFQSIISRNIAALISNGYLSSSSFVYCIDLIRIIDITEIYEVLNRDDNLMICILNNADIQKFFKRKLFEKYSMSPSLIVNSLVSMIKTLDEISGYFNVNGTENSEFHDCIVSGDDPEKPQDLIQAIFLVDPTIADTDLQSLALTASEIYMKFMLRIFGSLTGLDDKCKFDLYFIFTYNPPYLFDRLASQRSLFINQLYLYKKDMSFDISVLHLQKIIPDVTIEILHPNILYQAIRNCGINFDTIFGDFDNIARAAISDNPPISIRNMPPHFEA